MTAVAIIGGGFTGAAVAIHLAAAVSTRTTRIVVFEPRRRLGAGLAYDTDDPAHRINVPAARMSLFPGDDTHFVRWLEAAGEPADDPGALRPDGSLFPRRELFGRYVNAHVAPLVARGEIEYVRDAVADVRRTARGWLLETASGGKLEADVVVNATIHPPPSPPPALDVVLAGHPRYVPDPNVPGALDPLRPDDRVLVVGTGLTGADIIASLAARGHRGPVTAISRRGQRSRGHGPSGGEPFGDFATDPARTATALLRAVRHKVRAAEAAGLTRHPVFDALRAQGGPVWAALPVPERARLVRHLRAWWDIHRFRIAPQVEAVIDQGLSEGRISLFAARVGSAGRLPGDAIAVDLRRRGASVPERLVVDAVVLAVGPAHASAIDLQPHLRSLAEAGLIRPDDVGLGLACDAGGHAISAAGATVPSLFIAGPLARGTFGELMGLPQVSDYAAFVARQVAERLADSAAA